jgi:hypothetical protein
LSVIVEQSAADLSKPKTHKKGEPRMTEQEPKCVDGLFDELQTIEQHLRRAANLIEDTIDKLSQRIHETRETNAWAIAGMIEEALRLKQLPGSSPTFAIQRFCGRKCLILRS